MLPLAEQGDPIALNAIGIWYSDGILYPKNRKTACDWYEKSALKDYASAQYNLARCYDEAGGRKSNPKSYLLWMTKAAEQTFLQAQLALMFWYNDKNKKQTEYWGKKAAAQGSTAARVALWSINRDNDIEPVRYSEILCYLFKVTLLRQNIQSCDEHHS